MKRVCVSSGSTYVLRLSIALNAKLSKPHTAINTNPEVSIIAVVVIAIFCWVSDEGR